MRERQLQKPPQPPKIYTIKQQSNKKAKINQELHKVKNEIELEALQNGEYYCKGCGSGVECDKSHILSIKQFPEYELDKENIDLLCRLCHVDWESGDIGRMMNLHCFPRYMEYIKRKAPLKYNQIVSKMESQGLSFLD
jgi:hypothetical protein